jgi:hypothetical protein
MLDIEQLQAICKEQRSTIYRNVHGGLLAKPTKNGWRSYWSETQAAAYLMSKLANVEAEAVDLRRRIAQLQSSAAEGWSVSTHLNHPAPAGTGTYACSLDSDARAAARCVALSFPPNAPDRAIPADPWWLTALRADRGKVPARPVSAPRPMGTESRYA